MNGKGLFQSGRCLAMLGWGILLAGLLSLGATGVLAAAVDVDDRLLRQFQDEGTAGYVIVFRERAALAPAYTMEWSERGRFVVDALREAAGRSQGDVKRYLDGSGVTYRAFWIDNVILVESSGFTTLQDLQGFPEIAALRAMAMPHLIEPEERVADPGMASLAASRDEAVEPNIARVRAPDAWAQGFEGEGMVIGIIDTGVRYTHEALVNQYRGNLHDGSFEHHHNWWDPNLPAVPVPYDGNGHGTHVAGVAVGDDGDLNRIGVAPRARWMACRGCPDQGCTTAGLLECAQFMAAPWDLFGENADPDLRPHVVNNAWGDCQFFYNGYFQGVVDSWQAAGMVPVFANGNAGNCALPDDPPCGSVGNPARYGNVIGVGSTGTSDGRYAPHALKGPTDDPWPGDTLGFPAVKPGVAAPGINIRSAVSSGNSDYQAEGWTGTSMSTPHVAGAIALLWEAAPCLVGDYAATVEVLSAHADGLPHPNQCGGEGPGGVPNNVTGWGEINIHEMITAGTAACAADGPALALTALDFGPVVAGQGAGPRSVLVRSIGSAVVTVNAVQPPAAPFALAGSTCDTPPFSLPPGQHCRLDFSFNPGAIGVFEAPLRLQTPDGETSVQVRGTGIATLAFSPGTLSLPPAEVGTTTHPYTVMLRNLDTSAATGLQVSPGAGGFEIDATACGHTLPTGQECPLLITFSPVGPGPVAVTVDAEAHQPAASASLALAGRGVGQDDELIQLISRAEGISGDRGNMGSGLPAVSASGRYIAFISQATNLHPDANSPGQHVYVRDLETHEVYLVSRASGIDGVVGNAVSFVPAISGDGRFVAFFSSATNLHPDPVTGRGEIYLRDLQTHETILVSRADGVAGAALGGNAPAISADGRYVAFISGDLHASQIYVRDLQTHENTLVSRATGADGAPGDAQSSNPLISADGRYVTFASQAGNLHPDASDAVNDVYMRDQHTDTTYLISRAAGADGVKGNGSSYGGRISADGRFIAFHSTSSNLHPDATDNLLDVYLRDLQEDTVVLISRAAGVSGAKGNQHSDAPSISADGRFVAFLSNATNLHPDDSDQAPDIYLRDTHTDEIFLISRAGGAAGAKSNGLSTSASVFADGRGVAFTSDADNLHPDARDASSDVYLRRLPESLPPSVDLIVSPEFVMFGNVPAGETSTPAGVTLFSTGTGAVGITGVSAPAAPFGQAGGNCGSAPFALAPGESCTLLYTLAPQEEGFFNGVVTISTDAPAGEVTVFMVGQSQQEQGGNISMTPPALSFTDTVVDTSSTSLTVIIQNLGQVDMTGTSLHSGHPEWFQVDSTDCADDLPPGESCQMEVTFTPPAPGLFFSNITIINDQFFFGIVPVVGNGIAPPDRLFDDRFEDR